MSTVPLIRRKTLSAGSLSEEDLPFGEVRAPHCSSFRRQQLAAVRAVAEIAAKSFERARIPHGTSCPASHIAGRIGGAALRILQIIGADIVLNIVLNTFQHTTFGVIHVSTSGVNDRWAMFGIVALPAQCVF
jgi:hypothetical protein